ncbi:MAG: DUF1622 domain-containing protein [Thaumarchaeota archaeon]|nr:MAG: DUF1622 domain-containing protein [Nitrososphaerota archaeon]TLY12312.1 MAG: DUF1622 domain-containing protein [Nitrososphaerota archaeon]
MAIDLSGVLTAVLDLVIPFLELVAALIILGGGVWALTIFARRRDAAQARREFSHALLLGLDFTIGADMLKLARAPDLSAAALAAGVTAVRIALTLTLLREERLAMAPHPPST